MRVLPTPADVSAATTDPIARWASQALLPGRGGTAWAHGDAVAVLAPALFRFDRLVLTGPAADVATLLRAHVRPDVRPLVTTAVAEQLDWPIRAHFGWMERTGSLDPTPGPRWLTEDHHDEVESLLRKANPDPWVRPGRPGASRWAGIHVDGALLAVAADAWPSPEVGFIAGVATHPDHRGRGLSTTVCRFVAGALLAERGTCGLMVDRSNEAAIAVYRRLGFTYRSVTALRDPAHT